MEVFEKGESIIQILLEAGFTIKKSKVKGPTREIQLLGVKWQDGWRQIPTEVISKITTMSPPTSKKETQAFLAIGFWRMHIPDYSQIVSPLHLVPCKKNEFHWGPEQQPAFAQIKQEIAHAAQQVKPLWYGGRWCKYKYGEAWQIDSIPLPQTRQGKRYAESNDEDEAGTQEHKAKHKYKKADTISYSACAAQVFFFAFFIAAEYFLLTVMCYDRYVSICKPLHYGTLLGSRACAHMAAAAWASAFLHALLHRANAFSLPLCHGNALGQFFCEIPHILKLSCSHSTFRKNWISLVGVCLAFGCFVFIVFSYVQIFRAVVRIPSEQGRHKAFSTCLPHLAVVSLFLSTSFFAYLKPHSISSPSLDLGVSILYSVVPPALNPLIYSLRKQKLKAAVRTLMTGQFQKH
ncbi:olfactory receptor 14A16-like [Molothrus aeneus]|uniref:olfactory receptor 14A16-like n=1 Tax=Molothrus aeneus TaxID=84833 RepID=UPI00345A8D75